MNPHVMYYPYDETGAIALLLYGDERDAEVNSQGGLWDAFIDAHDGSIRSVCIKADESCPITGFPLDLQYVQQEYPELVKIATAYVQRFVNPFVDMEKRPSGNLRILLRNRRAVQEIMNDTTHMRGNQGFLDCIEYWLANGWDVPSNGINCFYGLTDTMAITDDWCDDDDGFLVRDCRVYCYMDGWRYDEVEQLLQEGYIDLEWFDAEPLDGHAWTPEQIEHAQETRSWTL